ncbi:MAG: hypothetical protein ACREM6_02950, partial [Vulcanimicrobiaceae bacterium]
MSKLAFAGTMIGMHMCGNDRLDSHTVAEGTFEIFSDLKLRIDDRRAALTPSTEDVRSAAGFRSEQLTKDHNGTPVTVVMMVRGCVSRMRTATTVP